MIPFNLDFVESDQCIDLNFGDVQVATKEDVKYTTGTVKGVHNGSAVVVEHGLGKTPSRVIFFLAGEIYTPTYSSSSSTTVFQSLFSDVRVNAEGSQYKYSMNNCCLTTSRFVYYSSGSTTPKYTATNTVSSAGAILTNSLTSYENRAVHAINETTFETPKYIRANTGYRWIAFA